MKNTDTLKSSLANIPIQEDWRILDLSGGAVTGKIEVGATIVTDPQSLTGTGSFNLVVCRPSLYEGVDLFQHMLSVKQVLHDDGYCLIHDYVMPAKEKVARYVSNFMRFTGLLKYAAFAQYEWEGVFLDVGLTLDSLAITSTRHELAPLLNEMHHEDITRAHVLLSRAPQAVAQWFKPAFAGTQYAAFTVHEITAITQKK